MTVLRRRAIRKPSICRRLPPRTTSTSLISSRRPVSIPPSAVRFGTTPTAMAPTMSAKPTSPMFRCNYSKITTPMVWQIWVSRSWAAQPPMRMATIPFSASRRAATSFWKRIHTAITAPAIHREQITTRSRLSPPTASSPRIIVSTTACRLSLSTIRLRRCILFPPTSAR